ncbi:MAG: site-2 protease family protein [Pegethrix bostrychoides GSE-TBD4-15B]|jgi:membrane-associated protease RseP (regulator of RpoE activity)|uniref:Site-2 protease family protein n=1 Tax=Pegethrix bostrychoides GSE-TBD4-15B TaxID=2839662 RepID=A0A951U6K0_9CYAN|nr:site-2 protease family protein [Pegethrix bostrychoides GSE-TBD4-15B]
MITVLMLITAAGTLGWGFYRARPHGKLGLLAWLQSVVLMLPWLAFFGLLGLGIYLNAVSVLFLLLASIVLYIALGRQLRSAAPESAASESAAPESIAPESAASKDGELSSSAAQAPQSSQPSPTEPTVASKLRATRPSTRPASPSLPPMDAADLLSVKEIFGIDSFFATETVPYQNGAIFKGNLRGDPEASHKALSAALQQRLGERYRLFLVEGVEEKPVVVVLPSSNDPQPTTAAQKILALILALATLATCLEVGGLMLGFDFFSAPERYAEVLPIAGGILAVLLLHELGHRLLARRYQVRLSPPFFLPALQIGSFGSLMRFESLLPNRTALFDIAAAGPVAGGLLALGMLMMGLLLSHSGSLFQVPVEFLRSSILVGTLARLFLGSTVQAEIVDVHPLVVVGWLGLVITAINLMPAGQLDGGRIVQAIYGRRTAGRTTIITLILLGLAALINPLSLYWAIIILFLQRDLERPALNELLEPDDRRAAIGLLLLFIMAAILLPLTPSLAGRLGIGLGG